MSYLHDDATSLNFTIFHFASWNTLNFPQKRHLATGERGHCTFLTACVSNAGSSFSQQHRICARLFKRSTKSTSFSMNILHISYTSIQHKLYILTNTVKQMRPNADFSPSSFCFACRRHSQDFCKARVYTVWRTALAYRTVGQLWCSHKVCLAKLSGQQEQVVQTGKGKTGQIVPSTNC